MASIPNAPLCVKLEGTLLRTNLSFEVFFSLLRSRPRAALYVLAGLLTGKAGFASRLAAQTNLDVTLLPYNLELLQELAAEARTGRPMVLTAQSSQVVADRIAAHVGVFDVVVVRGTGDRLIELYGAQGFDYIGSGRSTARVRQAARHSRPGLVSGGFTAAYLRSLLREMRVHQWLKNTLVFVPLITSHNATVRDAMMAALAAFVAFSLCASSVYVLNDLLDLNADRAHATKRRRPLASGALPITHGLVLLVVLLISSLGLSLALLPVDFLGVLAAYYFSTLLYTFWAKERVTFDVLLLAGLYTLRLLAGAAAIHVAVTFWLLAFSMFLFLSLAFIKRYTEMVATRKRGNSAAVGRGYAVDDMPVLLSMGTSAGYTAVLVLALYLNNDEVALRYPHPHFLWWLCPLLLLWISRVWIKTSRDEMHDDPIVFAATDRLSWIIGGAMLVAVLLATRV